MKFIYLASLFLSVNLFASTCKVSGISRSPQKLICKIHGEEIALHCENGTYYLNDSAVKTTYHLEVERGSNPLVFKISDKILTITQEKDKFTAELAQEGELLSGLCKEIKK